MSGPPYRQLDTIIKFPNRTRRETFDFRIWTKVKMVDSQKFWHISDCLSKSTNYGCWLYFTNHPLNFKLSLLCKQFNGWLEQSFSKNRFHISEIKFNWVELDWIGVYMEGWRTQLWRQTSNKKSLCLTYDSLRCLLST